MFGEDKITVCLLDAVAMQCRCLGLVSIDGASANHRVNSSLF